MKKYIIILLTVFIGLSFSCNKNYLDINNDPNSPSDASISPDLLIPAALTNISAITTQTNGRYPTLQRWLGVWCPTTNYAASDESKYQAANNTSDAAWTNAYDIINDLTIAENKASATGQTFFQGIAIISKSLLYQQLVDQFNNIPYSQAVNPSILQPKYDNADTIYNDLFAKITTGINLIKNADVTKNVNLSTADVMFAGNKTLWAKFGNSLKLRLLIHLSQMPYITTLAAQQIAIINAEGSGFLGAGQTANVNPGFSSAKPNPFWNAYNFSTACIYPNNFNRANNFSLNLMKNTNDVRYQYFYLPVRGTAGTAPSDWKGIDYAPINSDPQFNETKTSDIGGALTCAGGTTGLGKSAAMPAWVLTGFESLFLQSEAVARGWMPGNAQTLYNAAVTESFSWLGVPGAASTAATYLAQSDARIAWGANLSAQLVNIAWQKYIAFNGNNALEVWNDYRRLNGIVTIPLSLDPGRVGKPIPVRCFYPSLEYTYNPANANAQGTIDIYTSTIFWDR
jgi:Starch-binding associating with outer membrane